MAEWIERLAKYNFWNGQSFDLGYPREGYTTRIGQYVGNRLVKVLVGQRRAGKSYILRQLAKGLIRGGVAAENTLYINKEYIEFLGIRHAEDLEALYQEYRRELNPQGRVYIFIDEVQQVAEWERFVDSHSQDFPTPACWQGNLPPCSAEGIFNLRCCPLATKNTAASPGKQ